MRAETYFRAYTLAVEEQAGIERRYYGSDNVAKLSFTHPIRVRYQRLERQRRKFGGRALDAARQLDALLEACEEER